VFESRVLRRIFELKRDAVTVGWRKLHNEELHDLYSSPSIIRIIKSKRMRRAGGRADGRTRHSSSSSSLARQPFVSPGLPQNYSPFFYETLVETYFVVL
jgi:hypothetical protein